MARKKTIRSSIYPYHVSARCINKEWFKIPLDDVWRVMEDQLFFLHHAFNFEIHSFVLMSNHFHLLVRTPEANIDRGMNYFMRETSRQIGFEAGRINQTYGARYSKSLISNIRYYLCAYKYIYRNPVEAAICDQVEAYRYSTLHGLLGLRNLYIPVFNDETLFNSVQKTLEWLNRPVTLKNKELVRKALKKSEFTLGRDRQSREPQVDIEY